MAEELTIADVRAYVRGALDDIDDAEVQRLLDSALAKARRFCGWHVTPVRESTVTLRERGYPYVVLPTLKLVSIDDVTEDGETVDPTEAEFFTEEPGVIYRGGCGFWRGKLSVTFTHGFTAAEAADFRAAVLELIDTTIASIGTGGSGPLAEYTVDDVTLRWNGVVDRYLGGMVKNPLDESVLYQYRLVL